MPLVLAALLSSTSASATTISSSTARDLAHAARSVARGGSLRIEAATLDGRSDPAGLDLVRFDPVADGARFVVQTDNGPRSVTPDLPVYLRGSVDGMRGSVAVMSVRASGEMRGVVSGADGTWMLTRKAGADDHLRSRRIDRQANTEEHHFSCEVLENPGGARSAPATATSTSDSTTSTRSARLPVIYTAQIAVELDYDYYLTFAPDADAAILYALDLMAFTGALGEAELGMNVQVPFLTLWTTASDPYSSGTTRLTQVRSRWNAAGATNCGGIDCTTINRSTVILLSSAATGGVAYVPALCDSWHNPTTGYSYAYAGSIEGDFDIDSPGAVWDIVATTHELGHNFGSVHTHCYDPPVDHCEGEEPGCYSGPTSLPSGCPGPGQGCGTIMGYCHLLNGGIDNVSLTYGAGHPYGDLPDRVPATMIERIALEFADAPDCLAPTGGMAELEVTRTGSGNGTVVSSPPAIDCGSACRTYFDSGTVVTLTATPTAFSTFAGWTGDPDCDDGVLTLSAATSCTATFVGSCGAGDEDCDDGDPCTTDSCPGDDHCVNAGTPRDPLTCYAAGKSLLKITNTAGPDSDKLIWQWKTGEAFAQGDLGDPSSTTDYGLCLYDTTGGVTTLATSVSIPAGSPFWKSRDPDGWNWADSDGSFDGIKKVQLKTGVAGKTKVRLTASGEFLPLPAPFSAGEFFNEDPSVVVQLLGSDGQCWTTSFAAGSGINTPVSFASTGD